MAIADKPIELSEQVLQSLRDGEKAALEAVRKFVETLDQVLPFQSDGPLARQTVIDAALEMADKLVQAQYAFLHNAVRSAGQMMGATPTAGDAPPAGEAPPAGDAPPAEDAPPAAE